MRYIVLGTDTATGQAVRKVIEADSAGEAELIAQDQGLQVRGIQLDEGAASAAPAATATAAPPSGKRDSAAHRNPRNEKPVWEGGPSQWSNILWFLACILIIPIPFAVYKYFQTRAHNLRITTQRLQIETGIFSRQLEEIELYRVKDTSLERSFLQRLVGLGTVRMMTSDESSPVVLLSNLPDAREVRETIRMQVESARRARGVREFDVS